MMNYAFMLSPKVPHSDAGYYYCYNSFHCLSFFRLLLTFFSSDFLLHLCHDISSVPR